MCVFFVFPEKAILIHGSLSDCLHTWKVVYCKLIIIQQKCVFELNRITNRNKCLIDCFGKISFSCYFVCSSTKSTQRSPLEVMG